MCSYAARAPARSPGILRQRSSAIAVGIKSTHPEVEVVYLTIEDLPETFKFAKELGFDWRTVTYENTTMPSVNPYIDGRIPQLIVMDRGGKVLANGIQSTAPDALHQLDTLLKQPLN